MGGVFQIDREIFDNPIWENVVEFRLFFYIVGHAVWNDEPVIKHGIQINRGQYLRSYRNLREDLMFMDNGGARYYSLAVIKRTVDKLVHDERLKIEVTNLGTLFTVVNYELYQGFERLKKRELERPWNGVGTALERRWNNKKKENKENKIKVLSNDNTKSPEEEPESKSEPEPKASKPKFGLLDIQTEIDKAYPQPEVREVLKDFAIMRQEIKAPLTALGLKLLLKKLADPAEFPNPESIVTSAQESIISKWKSIYPRKNFGKPRKDTNYYDPIPPGETWKPGEMTMINDFDQDK